MNTARIVVLPPAVGAGGIAAYLASGFGNEPSPTGPAAALSTRSNDQAPKRRNRIVVARSGVPNSTRWKGPKGRSI
jgi:Flp pilus assembly protein CpaB